MKKIRIHECEVCKKHFEFLLYEDDVFPEEAKTIREICETCYYEEEAKQEQEETFCPYAYKLKGALTRWK